MSFWPLTTILCECIQSSTFSVSNFVTHQIIWPHIQRKVCSIQSIFEEFFTLFWAQHSSTHTHSAFEVCTIDINVSTFKWVHHRRSMCLDMFFFFFIHLRFGCASSLLSYTISKKKKNKKLFILAAIFRVYQSCDKKRVQMTVRIENWRKRRRSRKNKNQTKVSKVVMSRKV